MSHVVTLRIPDKEAWERAKQYARKQGVTIGRMVVNALELYMSREDRFLNELKELRAELRSLAYSSHMVKQPEENIVSMQLPSYLKDNPWVEILAERGKKPV